MTDKQKLEVLYELMGDVAFDEMFINIYTDILSLNDRTPHGLHHVTLKEVQESVKDDKAIAHVINSIDDGDKYTKGISDAKDVSVFILNPLTDTDLIIIQLHDITNFGDGVNADALNQYTSFATTDSSRIHMVNAIVLANMFDDLKRGRGSYVYGIMGHEIIHFLLHYLDIHVLGHKYNVIFSKDDMLVEFLCDIWSFILTQYTNNYDKYKDTESITKAYCDFLSENSRIPNDYITEYGEIFDSVEPPIWLRKLQEKLKKKK